MAKRSRRRRGGPVPGPREARRDGGQQQQQQQQQHGAGGGGGLGGSPAGLAGAGALLGGGMGVLRAVPAPPADAPGGAAAVVRLLEHREPRPPPRGPPVNLDGMGGGPLRPLLRDAVRPPADFLLDMQIRGQGGRVRTGPFSGGHPPDFLGEMQVRRSAGSPGNNARSWPPAGLNVDENHETAEADPPRAKSPPERKKPPQKPRARSRVSDGGPSLLEGVDTSTLTRHLKCLLPPDRLRALSSEGDGDCASVADAPSRLRTRPYSTRPGDGVLITHGEADAAGLGGRGLKALGFALRNYGRPAGGGSGGGGSERSELADLRITDSGVVGEDGHENGNENENDDEDVDGRRAGLWVCAGLEHNTSIKRLTLHGLGLGPAELAVLGRFVSGNPSLRILALRGCLGRADGHPSRGRDRVTDVDHLWPVVRSSPSAALEYLDLSSNGLSGSDLSGLHGALRGSSVRFLDLSSNSLGGGDNRGIAVLADILKRDDTRLQDVKAGDNGIDLPGALSLLESVRRNSTFRGFDLGENPFGTRDGWTAVLRRLSDIVCDTSSPLATIGSNHTLRSLSGTIRYGPGDPGPAGLRGLGADAALYVGALGQEDGMFLHEMMSQQSLVAKGHRTDRRKALVHHCRGTYNLGEEGRIPLCLVPRVLSYVANGLDTGKPPAQWCTLDVPSLGAVHAMMTARAEACGNADGMGFVGGTFRWGAVADECRESREAIRRLEEENERLRSRDSREVIRRLEEENERLRRELAAAVRRG